MYPPTARHAWAFTLGDKSGAFDALLDAAPDVLPDMFDDLGVGAGDVETIRQASRGVMKMILMGKAVKIAEPYMPALERAAERGAAAVGKGYGAAGKAAVTGEGAAAGESAAGKAAITKQGTAAKLARGELATIAKGDAIASKRVGTGRASARKGAAACTEGHPGRARVTIEYEDPAGAAGKGISKPRATGKGVAEEECMPSQASRHVTEANKDPRRLTSDLFADKVEWTAPTGSQRTYQVYQRTDIDWGMVRESGAPSVQGKTNLEAALEGFAPILPDGYAATLHHIGQDAAGPLAEASRRLHGFRNQPAYRALHNRYIQDNNPGVRTAHPERPVNQRQWENEARRYWKEQARNAQRQFEKN